MKIPRLFDVALVGLVLSGLCVLQQTGRADEYEWGGGATGSFDSPDWVDESVSISPLTGPPGPDDIAFIPQGTVLSSSGGSVSLLTGGGGLDLTGSFSAQAADYLNLSGSGTLAVGSLGADGTNISVTGAHLVAGNAPGYSYVDVNAGGSAVIQGSLAMGGGGGASDPMSLFEVAGSANNFNGGATNGGTFTAQSLSTDGTRDAILTATGAGSTVSIAGSAVFAGEGMTVSGGAQVTIGGNLDLYRPAGTVVDFGGSANVSGPGNVLSVAGQVQLADGPNASPNTSIGNLNIDSGSLLRAGSVTVDGQMIAGMITVGGQIQVVSGLSVGGVSQGMLSISGGVTVYGGSVAVGMEAGSTGDVQLYPGGLLQVGGGAPANLHVGNLGTGTMEITNATVQVIGAHTPLEIGSGANSDGTVSMAVGGIMNVAGSAVIGNLGSGELDLDGPGTIATVGGNFFMGESDIAAGFMAPVGFLNLTNGASFSVLGGAASNIGIGYGKGSITKISVTGRGTSLNLNGATFLGGSGLGQLYVKGGATAKILGASVGGVPGAYGELSVSNNGSSTAVLSGLLVGGTSTGQPGGKGFVDVDDGGLLTVGRELFISPTGHADVAGRIFVGTDNFGPDGAIRVGKRGVFSGKGQRKGANVITPSVTGNVVIGLGGRFLPGGDPGAFSVDGDIDLSDGGKAGGETDIEVAGTGTAGTDYDQVVATGKVTLGGTLKLVLMEGYKPQAGDTIEPVKAKTTTGSFQEVVAPGLTLSSNFNAGKLSVKIMSVADVPAPMITSGKTATAHVGEDFSYQIVATGLPAGYAATGLPAGLDIDPSTGLISGTPTVAGSSSVTLSSTSVGGTGKETLQLDVAGPVSASPAITVSDASIEAPPDAAFSYQIVASNSPTSYAATGLPPGLGVNTATGVISGKPTMDGNYMVTLAATNATGTGTAKLKLVVALPAVQVAATVPEIAAGSGKDGEFTLSIPAALKTPLIIHYKISGSAEPGNDYVALKDTAVIKAGQTTKVIKVVPRGDLDGALDKIVKLTLVKAAGYTLHAPEHAKVKIVAGQ